MKTRLGLITLAFFVGLGLAAVVHSAPVIAQSLETIDLLPVHQVATVKSGSEYSVTGPVSGSVFTDSVSAEVVTWLRVYPVTSPPGRRYHTMAYDSARKRVVLFGGVNGNSGLNDTWEWDGTDWTQKNPAVLPPARWLHALVYDSTRKRTVLFGGFQYGAPMNDTWEWDGINWVQRSPTISPSSRWDVMAYDNTSGHTILFGGCGQDTAFNETWEWDGLNWDQQFSSASPPARCVHAMACDDKQGIVMLFGGNDSINPLGDTWVWDGTNWEQQFPSNAPSARYSHAMVYDSARERIVLFGGGDKADYFNDTWEWKDNNWVQQFPVESPSKFAGYAMAYDVDRQRVVLFGGSDTNYTWEYGFVRLSASPATRVIPSGQTTVFSISLDGLPLSFTLSISSSLPSISGQFLPSLAITSPAQSTLVLTTSASMLDGIYPVTITAQANDMVVSLPVTLSIVTPDFGLVPSAANRSIYPGTTITYNIAVTNSATFTSPVVLDLTGLPAGVESAFLPTPVLPGSITTLWLTAPLSTAPGVYNFVTTGSAIILSDTIPVPLTRTTTTTLIVLPSTITPTISQGAGIYQGQATSYTIMVEATPGLTQPATLAIDGLDNMSATFWPNPVPLGQTTTLAITTTLDTAPGMRPFTITVSSHAITRTIQPALLVLPAALAPSVAPSSRTIYQEQVATYTIAVDATPGFMSPVTLAVDNLDGLAHTLSPNPILPGGTATMALTTTTSSLSGTRVFTVTASSDGLSNTTQAELLVLPAQITPTVSPASQTIYQEQLTVYTVAVEATPGFTLPVTLTVDNLDGLVYTFSPNPVLPGELATLTLTTTMDSPPGSRAFTITASGGGLSRITQAELIVRPAGIAPTVLPGSRIVYQGQFITYTVKVMGTPGLAGNASMNAAGISNAGLALWPNPIPLGWSGTLAITTTLNTAPDAHTLIITATTGKLISVTHTMLNVLPAGISLTLSPGSHTIYRGQGIRYVVSLDATPGFTRPAALNVSTLPAGVLHAFASSSVAPGHSTTLFITPSASTPLGIHRFIVTGAAAELVQAAQANLEIRAAVYLPLAVKHWPPIPYRPELNVIQGADDGEYTLTWTEQPARLAATYTLQEATDMMFTTDLREVCTTAQQSCAVNGKLAGIYYYRVRGYNTWGYGEWSNVQMAVVPSPGTPFLNSIDNSDQDNHYAVTWSAAERAADYLVQEDTRPAFSHPITVHIGSQISWSATGKTPGTYYYRVLANGPTGRSAWSNIQSVTIHPLFVGLNLRWDGEGYIRGTSYYDVGIHITRTLTGLTDADTIRIHNRQWYDPNPRSWKSDAWSSYYSISTGYLKSSSSPSDPSWKWGYPWILPYDWWFSNGTIFMVDNQAFSVSGPHSGYTAFGKAVQYWKLVNRDKFLYHDSGGDWTQYVHPGDITLWYDAGNTRLLLHRNVLRREYYEGRLTSDTVQYIYNLTSSNAFPGSGLRSAGNLSEPSDYPDNTILPESTFACDAYCAGGKGD